MRHLSHIAFQQYKQVVLPTFLMLALIFGSACENDIAEINRTFQAAQVKKEVVKDVTMFYSDSGQVEVKVMAPELHRIADRRNPRDFFPNGVEVEFYDEFGAVSSWLIADKATRYDRDDKIIARNNVMLYNVNRDTFRSEELIWDEQAGTVYTDRVFKFSSPDKTIYGYKFTSNQQFTDYTFYNMSGTWQVESLEREFEEQSGEQ